MLTKKLFHYLHYILHCTECSYIFINKLVLHFHQRHAHFLGLIRKNDENENLGQAELISTVHVVPVQVRKLTWARSVLMVFLLYFKNAVYLCFLERAQLRNEEWKLPERQHPGTSNIVLLTATH